MTEPITHALLDDPEGRIRHGFFSREGGVSGGLYDSLNCGYGSHDDPEAVRENRARAVGVCGLSLEALCTGYQVHSATALTVTEPWDREAAPKIDAMATATPGIALSILTADCVPVLFADRQAGVIGAAHAGWRGALDGILEAAVDAMRGLGARDADIRAVVGPCIRAGSYEVGPEFPAPFLAQRPDDADLFTPAARAGHFLFDLPGYVSRRLARLDIAEIAETGEDTCAEADRFFSYRRSCHRREADYGRNISIVALSR
jgi:YfiH family protein